MGGWWCVVRVGVGSVGEGGVSVGVSVGVGLGLGFGLWVKLG